MSKFTYVGTNLLDCVKKSTVTGVTGTGAVLIREETTCRKEPAVKEVKYAEVTRLIYQHATMGCPDPAGTTSLQISHKKLRIMFVNIEESEVQNVMAAFKVLNPAIKLVRAP